MSRYAVAQADFFASFSQNDERDIKTTAAFISKPAIGPNGQRITVKTQLPDFHCLWHDVSKGSSAVLKPCPNERSILGAFRHRLNTEQRQEKGVFV
jgi:hypothetical protein